jgi:predicted Fe-S protein YdhL (DUF1289 family)
MLYQESAMSLSLRSVAYTTFCKVWRNFLADVVVYKPMTDLCITCQKNSAAIVRSINMSEEEKSEVLKEAERHLLRATCERSYYRTVVRNCREIVKQHFTISGVTIPAPGSALPPGSGPDTMHYSFDFAQQVHYPHNPLHLGPMYFKTTRKCAVCGICCEGIPRQKIKLSYR